MIDPNLNTHLRDMATLERVGNLLGWDEHTMMPSEGAQNRGEQQALIAKLMHQHITDPRIEGWLGQLEGSSEPLHQACFRNLKRKWLKERHVSSRLVEESARACSLAYPVWVTSRMENDFTSFASSLEHIVSLTRERAERMKDAMGFDAAYDALLDQYDPGIQGKDLDAMFDHLLTGLKPILEQTRQDLPWELHASRDKRWGLFATEKQIELSKSVATALGYDFKQGRLDFSAHPFSSGMGAKDARITTRLFEEDPLGGLGSTIHEVGHALYELGLPYHHAGWLVDEAASYGMHESQSRFWENVIGRSKPFAQFLETQLRIQFPEKHLKANDVDLAMTWVHPGCIRVEADEVTYNFHIALRYKIEAGLFSGQLKIKDLPEVWNASMKDVLGVTPSSNKEGVLQDIHWAVGSFGYFPSYTLGNLYAAAFGNILFNEKPGLGDEVAKGHFTDILLWLREKVHRVGHTQEAQDILNAVSSTPTSLPELALNFCAYLKQKFIL